MNIKEKEKVDDFLRALSKAEAFVPDIMLPEGVGLSKNGIGSTAMITITKVIAESRKLVEELNKLDN